MPGADDDYYDDIDEGVLESLVIVALAAALGWLVYYRQQRQAELRLRGERGEGRGDGQGQRVQGAGGGAGEQRVEGQQADGGFFPPPEDPNFGAWVAGGVGH